MNNILDNLFYKEKLGIGNKATFINNVRERHPDISLKPVGVVIGRGPTPVNIFMRLRLQKFVPGVVPQPLVRVMTTV